MTVFQDYDDSISNRSSKIQLPQSSTPKSGTQFLLKTTTFGSLWSSGRYINTTGTMMTLRFLGNGVGVYGSEHPGHSLYNVTIDGTTHPTLDGSPTAPLFNQTPFNTTLDNEHHTLVLTDLGNSTLDIDYIRTVITYLL
ncbi:hypothetical protein BJ165DRAFT_990082 [Panaeolus papilionaceus]|nr:hypothetical protein BJ165DRAFT_990082 [Panaeolus papilionaceus]